MTQPDTDCQNAMRQEGEILARVAGWRARIENREMLAWDEMASLCVQVERDQARIAELEARLKPYEDYKNYVRRMIGDPRVGVHIPPADWGLPQNATTPAPQQAEPKPRESVAGESAMERARALAVSVPGGPGYDNRLLAAFATAITEAEQAARAEAFDECEAAIERAFEWALIHGKTPTWSTKTAFDAIETLAAKPPQPQKPEE